MSKPRLPRNGGQIWYSNPLANQVVETPTFTCCHCNRVVIMNPLRERPRNLCLKCYAWTCDHAVCVTECNPILESLELAINYTRHGEAPQEFLLRGPNGEPLYDPKLRKRLV